MFGWVKRGFRFYSNTAQLCREQSVQFKHFIQHHVTGDVAHCNLERGGE